MHPSAVAKALSNPNLQSGISKCVLNLCGEPGKNIHKGGCVIALCLALILQCNIDECHVKNLYGTLLALGT